MVSYRWLGAGFVLGLAWCAGVLAEPAEHEPRVPVVDCPANDQTGGAKIRAGESMPAAVEQPVAGQIAFYRAEQGPGIYAPKGWYCHGWDGSSGTALVVTPKRMEPPYFPLPAIAGPAVTIQTSDAGSSGRFHVAIVAAQLFPIAGSELITRVRQEHLISDASFEAAPHPGDQLGYLSDQFVEYTTPANRAGLGTDGLLEISDLPVTGLTILNPEAEVNTLTEVRVRLPARLSVVAEAIVELESACVQRPRGCRASGQ